MGNPSSNRFRVVGTVNGVNDRFVLGFVLYGKRFFEQRELRGRIVSHDVDANPVSQRLV